MKTRNAIAAPVAAAVLGALAAPAISADWELNPRLEGGYMYDDNYRLNAPGGEVSVSGPMVDAQVEWRALTQTSEFSFTPRVRATYFTEDEAKDLDAVDYFANLDWTHRGQRVTSALRGEFSVLDIITSEHPGVDDGGGLGEPDFGDGGRVLVDNKRKFASLRPSFVFDVSQRREVQVSGG